MLPISNFIPNSHVFDHINSYNLSFELFHIRILKAIFLKLQLYVSPTFENRMPNYLDFLNEVTTFLLSVGLLLSQIVLSTADLQYFLMVFSESFQYLK